MKNSTHAHGRDSAPNARAVTANGIYYPWKYCNTVQEEG